MDLGYKRLLRCFRKALRLKFQSWSKVTNRKRYEWNKQPELWFRECSNFLSDDLKLKDVTPENIWSLAILIQPTLAPPIYGGAKKTNHGDNMIFKAIGMEGLLRFRGIFDKNNHQ